jgi:hypothetical protein
MAYVFQTDTKEIFENLIYLTTNASSSNPVEHMQNRLKSTATDVAWTNKSRAKPSKPLFQHPSRYPEVSEKSETVGLYHKESTSTFWGWNMPYDGGMGFQVNVTREVFPFTFGETLPENFASLSANWQLPMALKIKKLTVNLGETLAEFNQTASMFNDVCKRLYSTYKYARRLKFQKALTAAKGKNPRFTRSPKWDERQRFTAHDVSATWLSLNFGIVPSVDNLFNAYIAQKEAVAQKGVWHRVYVKVKDSRSTSFDTGGFTINSTDRLENRATAWLKLEPEYHVDMGNPLELAWERIPFSFVVDWVFNVGDVLSSLDALKYVDKIVGSVNTKKSHNTSVSGFPSNNVPNVQFSASRNNDSEYKTYSREVILPHMLDTFNIKNIGYKPSGSFNTIANGLALLHQIRR